ncbi:MAG: DDE-type integrase/transposase/recombinase [Deltaproteobacteria bacterium]|nr:DDE-type integrase/transposase/recombinase [Deltaproteobacteria bacterium]
MNSIVSLVRWFCLRLSLDELFIAASIISKVLNGERLDIKCKASTPEDCPHYRKFFVDPHAPLTEAPSPKLPTADYKTLLQQYRLEHGKDLAPVRRRKKKTSVPSHIHCPNCEAPGKYLYYNDGQKRSQIRCKVCSCLFNPARLRRASKAKYWCPYCGGAMYRWKSLETYTIYKCPNDRCRCYLSAKKRLTKKERQLRKKKSSQFKLRYQFRAYHFDPGSLVPASPKAPKGRIDRIHNDLHTLSLVLAFNITYGSSARQTAHILRDVFQIPISHQTVLNYAQHAAVLCHKFNAHYKGMVDPLVAGDETYIRVAGEWNYTWFTIGVISRAIHAYHLSGDRGAKHAQITLNETIRTVPADQSVGLVCDGLPSYGAAVHAINTDADGKPIDRIQQRIVIGLKNEDEQSEDFRPFKQLIERLNRTYKFHVRARCGFKDFDGAVSLTVLFVTHYNFLRQHAGLDYKCPVPLQQLDGIDTIQGRWGKILQMAIALDPAA